MANESEVRAFFAQTGRQSTLDQIGIAEATKQFESGQLTDTRAGAPGGGGGQSAVDIARQLFEFAEPQRQKAIGTLRGGQAGITEAFTGLRESAQAQRPNVESRYQDTLEQIRSSAEKGATQQLTARGIPISSGIRQDIITAKVSPQISQAATQRDINLQAIQQLLANIGIGEQQGQQDILNTIAQIQSAASGEAIGVAQNIFSTQQAGRQADLNRQVQQAQLAQQQQQFQTGEARAVSRDPFEISLLEAQAANQRRLAAGGGTGTPFTPTAQTTQATFGNPPQFSPSRGEGSIFEQPDGSIWEFKRGNWQQFV